jgi:hypothetical protein
MTAIVHHPSRVDAIRVIGVTLGLSAGGAVFGATAGALGLAIAAVLGDPALLPPPFVLLVAGMVGGIIGAVLTPIAAWLLLRRVPFKRLFPGAVVGTVLGGVLGWLVGIDELIPIQNAVFGAVVGFLIAAVVMRRRAAKPAAPREEWHTAM